MCIEFFSSQALNPLIMYTPYLGIMLTSLAAAINLGWSFVLFGQGARVRSASLVADAQHLLADVWMSVGVVVGIFLVVYTGINRLDAVIAGLVALNVLWSGWGSIRERASGLLDEAVPAEQLAEIKAIISNNANDAIEAHAVRTRHAGSQTFIEFHLVVPGEMTVGMAHAICDRIEAALKIAVKGSVTTVHVEPEYKAKHHGIVVTGPTGL